MDRSPPEVPKGGEVRLEDSQSRRPSTRKSIMPISMSVVFCGLALALAYITGKIMDRNPQSEIKGLGLTVVLPGDPMYDDARLACESIRLWRNTIKATESISQSTSVTTCTPQPFSIRTARRMLLILSAWGRHFKSRSLHVVVGIATSRMVWAAGMEPS